MLTNIQQLQGEENRWLMDLPDAFFDLILFDEGHHNVAQSWNTLKERFPAARIVNFSATPLRADGQLMAGRILYSCPVFRAIREGYVKRLKAVVLNPRTLRYVRREDGQEIEVSLDEVRRLGERDAGFRRSIVTSTETLNTIVDASIMRGCFRGFFFGSIISCRTVFSSHQIRATAVRPWSATAASYWRLAQLSHRDTGISRNKMERGRNIPTRIELHFLPGISGTPVVP